MRISLFLLFAGTLQLIAINTEAQNTTIRIEAQTLTVSQLIHEIEKQTDFLVVFRNKEVDTSQPVHVKNSTGRVSSFLDDAFADTDIGYEFENRYIVITKKHVLGINDTPVSQQDGRRITGTVLDMNSEPVIGANIVVKGTQTGTVTDIDGNFSIEVPDANSILQFSYIGYIPKEVPVGNQQTLRVSLTENSQALDEVVVVGYGTMRKRDLTGSIMQIRPDKIADENPNTVQDVLRGIPGLQVGLDVSAKGGGSMQLRGQRSVYTGGGHNEPLIILDGMMFYGELSEINPDNIGQIDVLKDASAAAIYGAKAANGVIIISTKKGIEGKPVVNLTINTGFSTISDDRKPFGADGYMQYREDWYKTTTYGVNSATGVYEAYQTGETNPGYYDSIHNLSRYSVSPDQWRAYTTNAEGESDAAIYARRLRLEEHVLENYLAGRSFDWYKHSYQTGIRQDYNISVSGAGDRINYYMSAGYLKNEGVQRGSKYQSIRSTMKVNSKVTDWFEIGANVNFQDRSDGDVQVDDHSMLRNSPYSTPRDEDGNLLIFPMASRTKRGYNFDFYRQFVTLEKGYTVFNTILNASVKLPFGITYSFNASPRYQIFYDRYYESAQHPEWSAEPNGLVNREQAKRFDWSLNNTIQWDRTFAEKHRTSLTLVQEAEERRYWQDRIQARNILPTDALGLHNTGSGDPTKSSFSSEDTHETADALLARLFYSYDDRYMLTASVRRDGYSAFGQSNPYATFPSLAFGWSFVNENFFQWEPMSTGKLRVSWGKNGNRSLDNPYLSLADLTKGNMQGYIDNSGKMYNIYYLRIARMANPHLQWEKTESLNFGLDFGFFNNRITGNIEYYDMNTHDMIMNQRLPNFSGFNSITTNLGEVSNKGVEIQISSSNIKNKMFEWNTTLSISYNKNEIKHLYYEYEDVLDDNGNVIGSKERDDETNRWFIGQPISTIWAYNVTGIWQVDEIEEAKKHGQKPGDPKVANNYTVDDKVNADGSITPVYNDRDREFLGQTTPPILWSLRNDFTLYKNLDISFNIYSYMGHKSLSGNYRNNDNNYSDITYNYNTSAKEYWTPENPSARYGRLDAQGPAGATTPDRIHDRSFIRFENISIGYTLPAQWTQSMHVEKVKLYGSIRNVAAWSKDWEYGDPETGGLATRSFSLGLNVIF
ncbi:MAG: SusC/RagA family TonB-linked outer membrane protein [Tannerellaceae bacterium]|nr:SusC/RagA family TonB-linked outer membrane protein [Tannerellaceae bacterium]